MLKIIEFIKRIIFRTCSFEKRVQLLRKDGVKIWDNCKIYPNVSFGSEPYLIEIGNYVRITEWVQFTTHDGWIRVLRNTWELKNADKFGKVKVGNNVHIGMRAIVMPWVTIGDNVVIGAWSIVTKNIPSNSVAAGVPCKVIESIEEYYEKNMNKVIYTNDMKWKDRIKTIKNTYWI